MKYQEIYQMAKQASIQKEALIGIGKFMPIMQRLMRMSANKTSPLARALQDYHFKNIIKYPNGAVGHNPKSGLENFVKGLNDFLYSKVNKQGLTWAAGGDPMDNLLSLRYKNPEKYKLALRFWDRFVGGHRAPQLLDKAIGKKHMLDSYIQQTKAEGIPWQLAKKVKGFSTKVRN